MANVMDAIEFKGNAPWGTDRESIRLLFFSFWHFDYAIACGESLCGRNGVSGPTTTTANNDDIPRSSTFGNAVNRTNGEKVSETYTKYKAQ